jgi:hypothetical protein
MSEAARLARLFLNAHERARQCVTSEATAYLGCPETAAMYRASMELTRALAILRRKNR